MAISHPAPMLIADQRGLDFLNSVAAPWGNPIEWLSHGEAFLDWLEKAELIGADIAATIRKDALPGALDAVAAQARTLREWFRHFVLLHAGRRIESGALTELRPLNRLLGRDEAFGAIEAAATDADSVPNQHASGLRWNWHRRWRTPDALLLPVAQAMADLICEADFTQVKNCEGPTCTMLFLDTTKGHSRRWCSMSVCGNRAKQARHRAASNRGKRR